MNIDALKLALEELDKAEAEPIRHRYNWTLPALFATWEEYQSTRPHKQESSCNYLDRQPPRYFDCSCDAFTQHADNVEIATEVVVVAARELVGGSLVML